MPIDKQPIYKQAVYKQPMQAFLYALVFLTRLPLAHWLTDVSRENRERAVLYYPLVGAVIGLLLVAVVLATAALGPLMSAALVILAWVVITGALHLDGLADCLDGYYAGHKESELDQRRQRVLQVMQDPTSGAVAVAGMIVLLLLKFSALSSLLNTAIPIAHLLVVTVLARTGILWLISITEYAKTDGTAPALSAPVINGCLAVVLLVAALLVIFLPLWQVVGFIVALALLTLWWRQLWLKTIGGYTGDCLGALVEMSETLLLIVVLILWL
ncbi:MAG TPA: adenosylcobinamide-GDP ribazoletransferase [Cellvibrionaceae bacterium]